MEFQADIIVFSHLRWEFVYQRPQHLLSRMARDRRVIFIEEPDFHDSSEPFWQFSQSESNVLVCRPRTNLKECGFTTNQVALLQPMIRELLERERIQDYVLWFYSPMAEQLAEGLKPQAIVYDCMDELSAFRNAPPELPAHEAKLLARADLVFTGGPSLYSAKRDRHPSVHCFPSSVDSKHFASAVTGNTEAQDQSGLPHPRLGFFGVIDERFDIELLAAIADAHPDWQIPLVGPVVKIDPASLPRRSNIHYFGQRSYQELPSYLAGWDVCLLPFARNEATKYISPTKTLEYMAAGKMIVSTPIVDVAEPYGEIAYIGGTPQEFISACEAALNISSEERAGRQKKMGQVLNATSWEATVTAMSSLIGRVVTSKNRIKARRSSVQTAIIGGGPTGLSAAYHVGRDSLLIEQNASVGGWCRSIECNGFTFDYAGHIMFSKEPYVHQLYQMLLGDNVHWQDREAWIYSKNVYTRYPFQGALYGLPPDVIKECIIGAIKAQFGPADGVKNGHTNGHSHNGNGNGNGNSNGNGVCKPVDLNAHNLTAGDIKDCCADGILGASTPLVSNGAQPPKNFEEFIYRVWGAGIAKHFAIPYNRKLWAVPLSEMETSWLGGRVPLPDLEEMIEGALSPVPKPMGPNARFGYPLRGGFEALMNGWLPHLKGELRTGARVTRVSPSKHSLTVNDGEQVHYDHLISTMPLPHLIRQIGDEAPEAIRAAAARLRHVSVRCVHIGVGRENLTEKHWIYYPEDTVFHRIFVQGNASPLCNPPGGFGITCEITYSQHKPLPCDGDDLIKKCIEDCQRVGLFSAEDPILATAQCDLPYAYVVYDHARAEAVSVIRSWLLERDIVLAGRYSEWEYYNSDHAFIAGKKAADFVAELKRPLVPVPLSELSAISSSVLELPR